MLVSNEISSQPNKSKPKTSQKVSQSSGVQTCQKDIKQCDSMLKPPRSIALTTLPILNKFPNPSTVDSNVSISAKFSPKSYNINNATLKRFNLPNLSGKNLTQCSMASYNNNSTKDMASYTNNFTRNVASYNTRTWPLAGEKCPGFKPLGYRTRPTFGEQCLKTGNQWPSPREEPGPSLPYLDLFTDSPIENKCFEPVKSDVIAKPAKPVSWFREKRFPALIDAYNIRNGLFSFGGKSHPISGDFIDLGKKDQAILSSADFPEVASCKLNKAVNQKRDKNAGLHEVFDEDCSECPLCRKEVDTNMLKSNSPKYHIHLPSTD